jgi:hypothetical protein
MTRYAGARGHAEDLSAQAGSKCESKNKCPPFGWAFFPLFYEGLCYGRIIFDGIATVKNFRD